MEHPIQQNAISLDNVSNFYFSEWVKSKCNSPFAKKMEPHDLSVVRTEWGLEGLTRAKQKVIKLEHIVGTSQIFPEVDSKFRPSQLQSSFRTDWEKSASAILSGVPAPVIKIYQYGEPAFVLRKRDVVWVSALRCLGFTTIAATVFEPQAAAIHRPTIEYFKFWFSK